MHKWAHYIPISERHFAPYRDAGIGFVEIGVATGGSAEMWRDYFGPVARIVGIDIDPACAGLVSPPNQDVIGSQANSAVMAKAVDLVGPPDIMLYDGSHIASHQRASFRHLFSRLRNGGLYVIEDTHTSYWHQGFEGGYRRRGSAIEFAKRLVDDMHGWYHRHHARFVPREEIAVVHFYDSIIVIEKSRHCPPAHVRVGTPD